MCFFETLGIAGITAAGRRRRKVYVAGIAVLYLALALDVC